MLSQEVVQGLIDGLVNFATNLLMPFMLLTFMLAIFSRLLIYYTVKRHDWFSVEFEKRVNLFFLHDQDHNSKVSFFVLTKRLLEKTFYEIFEYRSIMKRRKPDVVMDKSDRLFLVKQGSAWLVNDLLKHVKHLRHGRSDASPKLLQLVRTSFQKNPAFNKLLGVIPASPVNDLLGIMPGIFIICGIFGTFLGIMKALPELGTMDISDSAQAKMVMDEFLLKISFAMSTSLLGILLSVVLSVFNTIFSPDKVFTIIVDRFENTLDLLWNRSTNNELPHQIPKFDENKDPVEALAEEALNREIAKLGETQDRPRATGSTAGEGKAS